MRPFVVDRVEKGECHLELVGIFTAARKSSHAPYDGITCCRYIAKRR